MVFTRVAFAFGRQKSCKKLGAFRFNFPNMYYNVLELCAVCGKSMIDPRILPCAHSFCLKCLENEPSKCPKCLIGFQIPEGGLKDLKKNEFIEQLSILKQNVTYINCDSCKENQAIQFCAECAYNYCSTCLEHHGRIPVSNNHQLQPAIAVKSENRIKVYSKCKEHSEDLNMFCERCEISVCGRCLYLYHNSHKIKHMLDHFESAKQKLEDNLKTNQQYFENVTINRKSSDMAMSDNLLKASTLRGEILQRGEYIKKAIDSIVNELVQKVDEQIDYCQKEKNKFNVVLENIDAKLITEMETLEQYLKDLNYQNVIKVQKAESTVVNIPKYSEKFNFYLAYAPNQEIAILKKIFGTLKEGRVH